MSHNTIVRFFTLVKMSQKSPQSDERLKSYIKRKEEEEEEEDDEPFFSTVLLLWRARTLGRFACCVCKSPVRSRARHDHRRRVDGAKIGSKTACTVNNRQNNITFAVYAGTVVHRSFG